MDALLQPVTTGFGFPQQFYWPVTICHIMSAFAFLFEFLSPGSTGFSFSKSYCRAAAAVGEFMKFANGYPPQQGELILLNVTSVYPQ